MSIRLRSRRGPIGTGWHAIALRTVFEGILGSQRSAAGRRIARADLVQWIDVDVETVRGAVEDELGSLQSPEISVTTVRPDDREAVLEVAVRHPALPVRLASGEYPQLIEKELEAIETPILPRSIVDLFFDCSCLDWPGPCKHVAALMFVLVETVDEDPVALLRWRGISLEDVAARRSTTAPPIRGAEDQGDGSGPDPADDRRRADDRRPEGDRGPEGDPGPTDDHRPAIVEAGEPPEDLPEDEHQAAAFDPLIADPSLLTEAIGEDAARILGTFYRGERPGS